MLMLGITGAEVSRYKGIMDEAVRTTNCLLPPSAMLCGKILYIHKAAVGSYYSKEHGYGTVNKLFYQI